MKKFYADESIIWYDQSVKAAIEKLDEVYPTAITVFGGALSAANYVNGDTVDMAKFCHFLADAIDNAEFFGWHEDAIGVIRRFCGLCHVDTALVEAYLGTRL